MSTSPSIYDSGASNLDILNSVGEEVLATHDTTHDTPSEVPVVPGADTAAAAGTPTPPGAGASGTEEVKPEWYETAPAEFKALMAQQNVSAESKKWLEETYGKYNEIQETPIGNKEAVQELTEMFPGGIEDIREAHQNAAEFVKEMSQFNSGDPAQQTELLATLVQSNPEAFVSMIGQGAELLKQVLRDDYTAFASNLTHDHLEAITDGKFSQFFDGLSNMAKEYNALADTNPESASKLASKLGGMALQMADWWGSAKNKMGYGTEKAPHVAGGRAPVVPNQPDAREVALAEREANFWTANYMLKHDSMVNPLISSTMTRELAARKIALPQSWQNRVLETVANGIKQNLHSDKTYLALENRIYRRGAPGDPRKWDNSEQASRTLLNAVKQRAEKLVPNLLKRALDDIAALRGTPTPKPQPGANVRGSERSPAAGGGGNSSGWEQDLKEGKISTAEAVARMAGV